MLSAPEEEEEQKIATALEDASTTPSSAEAGPDNSPPPPKKRKHLSPSMGKELTADQKAVVKMNVSRGQSEGVVKCSYCDKEITSRNVDRWASHLRGCTKTPEEIKALIQPFHTSAPLPGAAPTSAHMAPTMQASAQTQGALQPTKLDAAPASSMSVAMPSRSHVGGRPSAVVSGANEVFKVHVSKDYMKFNAAHFIAFKGFREKLHGHNYRVAVTITGMVGSDGYVVDFGEIKNISRVICKDLNESFLVPMNSDSLKISFDGTNVHLLTEDMAKFSFPKADCSLLPIVHSSAEELAIYISNQIIDAFTIVALLERGVRKVEVSISEATQQFASYERSILG